MGGREVGALVLCEGRQVTIFCLEEWGVSQRLSFGESLGGQGMMQGTIDPLF